MRVSQGKDVDTNFWYDAIVLQNFLSDTDQWVLGIGNLFGKTYEDKIKDFKDGFDRAKSSFDRSISLEMFVAINGIG